ncbi:DUF6603 domain-containing protein [Burkholderia arboris]|uniref:DUF6603 domain-containing protein n=1 Tax=Burkholderia arboris TaxID=488730 RepID=UPI0030F11823
MDGSRIQDLLNKSISSGVLTLQAGQNSLDSERIDTLLTDDYCGTLTATLSTVPSDTQVGASSVTYANARVQSHNFVFFPKGVNLSATVTVSTTDDRKLDLQVLMTMPANWSLPQGLDSGGGQFSAELERQGALQSVTVTADSAAYRTVDKRLATASIAIGGISIVTAGYDKTDKTIALSQPASAAPIGIDLIGRLFGVSGVADLIPPNLDLGITALSGAYSIDHHRAVFECTLSNWNDTKVDLVAWKSESAGWSIFFSVGLSDALSLTDLPLIGKMLSALTGGVKLDAIQVALASAALTADDAKTLTDAIDTLGKDYPVPPAAGLKKGATLLAVFDADGQKTPLNLNLLGGDADHTADAGQQARRLRIPLAPGRAEVASSGDGTHWFSLQKSFGPVTIQKVGIRYKDGDLAALLNASIAPGGLTIAMDGLGIETPLKKFDPTFTIDGILVSLKEGPVSFSGGLIGSIAPKLDLVGELGLSFGRYQLGAIAGYAAEDGDPSFFLYGVLDAPLGGPVFIVVTGIAAGFGLNRTLVVPDVDGVDTFPLVEWAVGDNPPSSLPGATEDDLDKQVSDTLSSLASSGVVAPKIGEDWFAAGVRFTSFKLIDCFALATIKFAHDLEVDLLGLATVKVPPDPATPTLAEAQLALKTTIQPSTGLIAVTGQLTPNSYVLSKACKLTGGFALCMWVAGPHAGDFVLTIGGYSPHFTPPDHYPQVPRLGLAWQVSGALSVTGDMYFALTASAVMAGGGLKAVWHSGPVQAWFDVETDFLMAYTPFHYALSASVELGASVRVSLLFVHVTVSIHLGVGLEIWGPEFSGKARVDLKIVKFTLSFGGGKTQPAPVSWSDFVTQLLPSQNSQGQNFARVRAARSARQMLRPPPPAQADALPPAVVQIVATNGLVTTLSNTDGDLNWLVDRQTFRLQIQTVIPFKHYSSQGNVQLPDPGLENLDFGVGPVGIASDDFQSSLEIVIKSNEDSQFQAVKVLGNVAKAMWEYRSVQNGIPQIGDPLNQTTIANVLTGFELSPCIAPPEHTKQMPIEPLQYSNTTPIQPIDWSTPVVETSDPFNDETVARTIDAPLAGANRPALLAAMQRAGLKLVDAQSIDVSTLHGANGTYLQAPPALRYLGEAK